VHTVKRSVPETALAPVAPRTRARIRALLHPAALDRRLAAGADPARDPELAARAAVLLRRTTRRQIAAGLESAVAAAYDNGRHPLSAAAPVAVGSVRDSLDQLTALAERLRAPEPVRPQGVALARELLVDGTGPLYAHQGGGALEQVAISALAALDYGPAWV
jgi:hypothetical protein